jgi:hypothetical protein
MLAAAVEETLIAPGTPHGVAHGGERVGDAVDSVPAGTSLKTLAPKLKTSLEMVKLNLGPAPSEAELETLSTGTNNASHKRYASRLLVELKAGKSFARAYDYPLAVWRLGDSQILVALGGEPVVDYALKFKSQFGSDTWVAGYSNDVMTYIPSLRVLKEGGYEGGGAMVPYGMPALRWDDDVEELITAAAGRLVSKIRAGE